LQTQIGSIAYTLYCDLLVAVRMKEGCVAADMDGFKLLEHIGLELDLPVISAHPSLNMILTLLRPLACEHCRN